MTDYSEQAFKKEVVNRFHTHFNLNMMICSFVMGFGLCIFGNDWVYFLFGKLLIFEGVICYIVLAGGLWILRNAYRKAGGW